MTISKCLVYVVCLLAANTGCKKSAVDVPEKEEGNSVISHSITSYTVGSSQVGSTTVKGDSILIYVKQGTNLATVKPIITLTAGSTISPASGQTVDFITNPVITYTETLKSGSKKWYVKVSVFPKPSLANYNPNPQPDAVFQGYFTRYKGWNSGDGAQSVLLPDGRTIWIFGDSFVGDVNPDRTRVRNKTAFINNVVMMQNGTRFTSHYGGTEANVAVSLAVMGVPTRHVSRVSNDFLGKAAVSFFRGYGVDMAFVQEGAEPLGLYFSETGAVVRSGVISYNRNHSAFRALKPEAINWTEALNDAGWLHWTGITPAHSENNYLALKQALETAQALGITVSCDPAYRNGLWQYGLARWCGTKATESRHG
ncbi:MAG: DUF5005 domain-containing protein [Sphingobacteriales bacterium]|nr:MAG: DUF5005 domain-containing protein [Sphingobacteriales bacterium]